MALVPSRVVQLAGLRKITAARTRESLARTAQLTLHREVDAGPVRPRSALTLSLTFDHQVADGAGAASLLAAVARRLGTPAEP